MVRAVKKGRTVKTASLDFAEYVECCGSNDYMSMTWSLLWQYFLPKIYCGNHVGSWLRKDHYSVLDIMVQTLILVKNYRINNQRR